MTQTLNIVVGEESSEVVNLSGIPTEMWAQFKTNAEHQFPLNGELAWAAFLSEVIAATSGGNGEVTSYFMTKVPVAYATALEAKFAQISMSWQQFHANILRTAHEENNLRLANFKDSGHTGTFIVTGIDPAIYLKVEKQTNHSFEQVMATVIASAAAGTLIFGEGTKFMEPIKND